MNIKLPTVKLGGQFRLVISKDAECKQVVKDTGFFDNLITNTGMNRIGTVTTNSNTGISSFQTLCGRFVVGSGSAEPQFTDTALQNPVAFASSSVVLDNESSNYERGWYEITVRHQFGQGQAAGNLSEIGIQHTSTSGPLWSRALILDGEGNPTTITVLPDDFLTCYYTLRIMIPKEDAVFNINVDYGEDGIVPTIVTGRPLNADNATAANGWGLQTAATSTTGNASLQFYTGGLAAPTANSPLGSPIGNSTFTFSIVPYVHDSFERYVTRTNGLNEHNSQQLRTARVNALMGCWQIEFDPPLQKDNTQTMQVTFGYSWARA
jgi:hypothetical protein